MCGVLLCSKVLKMLDRKKFPYYYNVKIWKKKTACDAVCKMHVTENVGWYI